MKAMFNASAPLFVSVVLFEPHTQNVFRPSKKGSQYKIKLGGLSTATG